jgi:hypothetical protein
MVYFFTNWQRKSMTETKVSEVDFTCIREKDYETINSLTEEIFNIILDDVEVRKEKLLCSIDEENFVELSFGQLLIALIAIKALILVERDLTTKDFLIIKEQEDAPKKLKAYFDKVIKEYDGEHNYEVKEMIADCLEQLATYMYKFNEVKGNTINLFDMFKMAREDPELHAILNFKINEKLQFHDMEESVKQQCNLLVKKIMDHGNNCYADTLKSVSIRQFQQVFVNISLKPDLYGNIYPKPINTSFLRGMRDDTDYFINAMGARKALIINSSMVRNAGYLSRKLSLLVLNQTLSETYDCKTPYPIHFDVDDKKILGRLDNRYYEGEGGKIKLIRAEDEHLIGMRVKLRSPITCTLPGNEICKVCYGALHKINNLSIGLAGVLILTEQITQSLLSSKHLLQINASRVEISGDLTYFFELDKDILCARDDYTITFESPLENEDTGQFYIDQFTVHHDGKEFPINLEGIELLVDPIINNLAMTNTDETVNVLADQEVFKINIENTELSTPLKKLLKKLESDEKLNEVQSISYLLLDLLTLLEKSNISSASVNIELILREMLRDINDIQRRPLNFYDSDNYRFVKLQSALLHNPSAAVTLAFERIKFVIENNLFQKDSDSIIDSLY